MLVQERICRGVRTAAVIMRFETAVQHRLKFSSVPKSRRRNFTLLDVATNDNSPKRIFEAVREIVREAVETRDWRQVRNLLQRNPLTTGRGGAEEGVFDSRDMFLAKRMWRIIMDATHKGTRLEATQTLYHIAALSESKKAREHATRRLLQIFGNETEEMHVRAFEYLNAILCGSEMGIDGFPELKRFVHENEAALSNPGMARKNVGIG